MMMMKVAAQESRDQYDQLPRLRSLKSGGGDESPEPSSGTLDAKRLGEEKEEGDPQVPEKRRRRKRNSNNNNQAVTNNSNSISVPKHSVATSSSSFARFVHELDESEENENVGEGEEDVLFDSGTFDNEGDEGTSTTDGFDMDERSTCSEGTAVIRGRLTSDSDNSRTPHRGGSSLAGGGYSNQKQQQPSYLNNMLNQHQHQPFPPVGGAPAVTAEELAEGICQAHLVVKPQSPTIRPKEATEKGFGMLALAATTSAATPGAGTGSKQPLLHHLSGSASLSGGAVTPSSLALPHLPPPVPTTTTKSATNVPLLLSSSSQLSLSQSLAPPSPTLGSNVHVVVSNNKVHLINSTTNNQSDAYHMCTGVADRSALTSVSLIPESSAEQHKTDAARTTTSSTVPASAAGSASKSKNNAKTASPLTPATTKWSSLCAATDLNVLAVATCDPTPFLAANDGGHGSRAFPVEGDLNLSESSHSSRHSNEGREEKERTPFQRKNKEELPRAKRNTTSTSAMRGGPYEGLDGLVEDFKGVSSDGEGGLSSGSEVRCKRQELALSHPYNGDNEAEISQSGRRSAALRNGNQRRAQRKSAIVSREEQRRLQDEAEQNEKQRTLAAANASATAGPDVLCRVYRHFFRKSATVEEKLKNQYRSDIAAAKISRLNNNMSMSGSTNANTIIRKKEINTVDNKFGENSDVSATSSSPFSSIDSSSDTSSFTRTANASSVYARASTTETIISPDTEKAVLASTCSPQTNNDERASLKKSTLSAAGAVPTIRKCHRPNESDSDSSDFFGVVTIAGDQPDITNCSAGAGNAGQNGPVNDFKLARRIFLQVREDAKGGVPRSSAALGPPDRYCHLYRERRRANICERVRGRVQRIRKAKQRYLDTSITTIRRTTSAGAGLHSMAGRGGLGRIASMASVSATASYNNLHGVYQAQQQQQVWGVIPPSQPQQQVAAATLMDRSPSMSGLPFASAAAGTTPQMMMTMNYVTPTPTAAGLMQLRRQQSGNVFFPQHAYPASIPFGGSSVNLPATNSVSGYPPPPPAAFPLASDNYTGNYAPNQQQPFSVNSTGMSPASLPHESAPPSAPYATFFINKSYQPTTTTSTFSDLPPQPQQPYYYHAASPFGGSRFPNAHAASSAANGFAHWHAQQQLKLQVAREALERELEDLFNQRARMEGIARLYSDSPYPTPDTVWSNAAHLAKLFLENAAVHAWRNIFSHTSYDEYKQKVVARTQEEKDDRMRRVLQRNLCMLGCFRSESEEKWLQDVSADISKAAEIYKPPKSDEGERQSALLEQLQQMDPSQLDEGMRARMASIEAFVNAEETKRVESFYFTYDFVCQCFPVLKGDLSYLAEYLLSQGIQRRITEVLSGGDLDAPDFSDISDTEEEVESDVMGEDDLETSGYGTDRLNLSTRSRRSSVSRRGDSAAGKESTKDGGATKQEEQEEEICNEEAEALKLLQTMTSPKICALQQPAIPKVFNDDDDEVGSFDGFTLGIGGGGVGDTPQKNTTSASTNNNNNVTDSSFFLRRKIDEVENEEEYGQLNRNASIITNAGDFPKNYGLPFEDSNQEPHHNKYSNEQQQQQRPEEGITRKVKQRAAAQAEEKRRMKRELRAVAKARATKADAFVKWFGLWCGVDVIGGLDSLVAATRSKYDRKGVEASDVNNVRPEANGKIADMLEIPNGASDQPAQRTASSNSLFCGASRLRSPSPAASQSSSSSSSCPESDYSNASAALDLKPRSIKTLFRRKHSACNPGMPFPPNSKSKRNRQRNDGFDDDSTNTEVDDGEDADLAPPSLRLHRSQRILRVARAVTDMLLMPPTHGAWSNRPTTAVGTVNQLLGGGVVCKKTTASTFDDNNGSNYRREQNSNNNDTTREKVVAERINTLFPQPQQRRATRIPYEPERVQK